MSNEILDCIQNIYNYYNENVFNGKIEINVLNLTQTTLYEYDKELDNEFKKLYKYWYNKSDKLNLIREIFVGQDWEYLRDGKIHIYIHLIHII